MHQIRDINDEHVTQMWLHACQRLTSTRLPAVRLVFFSMAAVILILNYAQGDSHVV